VARFYAAWRHLAAGVHGLQRFTSAAAAARAVTLEHVRELAPGGHQLPPVAPGRAQGFRWLQQMRRVAFGRPVGSAMVAAAALLTMRTIPKPRRRTARDTLDLLIALAVGSALAVALAVDLDSLLDALGVAR